MSDVYLHNASSNLFIVIADRFGTTSEFRRKNSISEGYDFVNQSTFLYNVRSHRAAAMMKISVSVGK